MENVCWVECHFGRKLLGPCGWMNVQKVLFFPPTSVFPLLNIPAQTEKKPISWGLFVVFIVDFLSDQMNNRFNAFKGHSTKRCEVSGYRKHSQWNRSAASSKATKPFKDSFLKRSFNDSITAAVQFSVKTSQWWIMAERLPWRNFSFGFSSIKMCGKTEVGTSKQSKGSVTKFVVSRWQKCLNVGFNNRYFRQNVFGFFFICPSHLCSHFYRSNSSRAKVSVARSGEAEPKDKVVRILVLNLTPESTLLYKRRKRDGPKNHMQKLPDYD